MNDTIKAPVRAHQLKLDIGADTKEDLARALKQLALEVYMEQLTVGCSGGPDWGGSYEYRHDPAITHDSYFAAVDVYLAAKKEAA